LPVKLLGAIDEAIEDESEAFLLSKIHSKQVNNLLIQWQPTKKIDGQKRKLS